MHDAGIFALAPPPQDGQQPSILFQLVPFLLIFVVFYFLVIAPMRKRQRKHADMVTNLKAGDRVVTSGGIHGVVKGVGDGVVQLKIADQVTIEVAKSAIADQLEREP